MVGASSADPTFLRGFSEITSVESTIWATHVSRGSSARNRQMMENDLKNCTGFDFNLQDSIDS